MPFHSTAPHLCPVCPLIFRKKWEIGEAISIGITLDLVESNYSGCGVDIAECPKCKRQFQISYKVDAIHEVKWQ